QQRGLILRELSKQLGLKEPLYEIEKSIGDNSYGESHLSGKKVKYVENEIKSESLQNLTNSEQSSEPSNRKLQSHKESVAGLDAAIEKKEADNRAVSVK
ncbi:hypothetical protein A2U01_0071476, partial [Trifolium medium]|nr:hypothetical protein [Trifolium medium]